MSDSARDFPPPRGEGSRACRGSDERRWVGGCSAPPNGSDCCESPHPGAAKAFAGRESQARRPPHAGEGKRWWLWLPPPPVASLRWKAGHRLTTPTACHPGLDPGPTPPLALNHRWVPAFAGMTRGEWANAGMTSGTGAAPSCRRPPPPLAFFVLCPIDPRRARSATAVPSPPPPRGRGVPTAS